MKVIWSLVNEHPYIHNAMWICCYDDTNYRPCILVRWRE